MSLIIHLVPQLPPANCGVGDYATLVGHKLSELRPETHCGYVACGHREAEQPVRSPGWRDATGRCDAVHLWRAIARVAEELTDGRTDCVSLAVHYSGYGFAANGAPRWLAEALNRRPPQFSAARIVTVFHELYATGWPWRKAFWMSAQQRNVTIRLARLSDALVTNRDQSARWLEEISSSPKGSVPSLPVPSNIGERCNSFPWELRAPHAVAFGGAQFKESFLAGRRAKTTAALCRKLDIDKLFSIGPRTTVAEATFRSSGIQVIQTGYLAAHEASAHFEAARIALVDYYPGYFAKSGILAAAMAHGTPPIFPRAVGATDGLRFGDQLWDIHSAIAENRKEISARLSSISRSARAWYDGHSLERHATLLADVTGNLAAVNS
ncbi:MAG TPA: hypothetical protein VGP76_29105 [Planctomycetaceae bacterium]|jgi:hypothetical protein|nr:hypothetical protein [Planctomycetaceae bacterium]